MTVTRTPDTIAALRGHIADELTRTRLRSKALTDAVDDDDLVRQHSPLMSPLVWDLAHVGNQEELWLLRDVGGREPMRPEIDELYDAFQHPRRRPARRCRCCGPAEARAYVGRGARQGARRCSTARRFDGRGRWSTGFVFGMIVQHEQQHDETMLATHQLRAGAPVLHARPPRRSPRTPTRAPPRCSCPAAPFTMGTSTEPWALDNERPAHRVDLPAFWIDTVPVTNGAYPEFVDDGGYDDPRWWTRGGLGAPAARPG